MSGSIGNLSNTFFAAGPNLPSNNLAAGPSSPGSNFGSALNTAAGSLSVTLPEISVTAGSDLPSPSSGAPVGSPAYNAAANQRFMHLQAENSRLLQQAADRNAELQRAVNTPIPQFTPIAPPPPLPPLPQLPPAPGPFILPPSAFAPPALATPPAPAPGPFPMGEVPLAPEAPVPEAPISGPPPLPVAEAAPLPLPAPAVAAVPPGPAGGMPFGPLPAFAANGFNTGLNPGFGGMSFGTIVPSAAGLGALGAFGAALAPAGPPGTTVLPGAPTIPDPFATLGGAAGWIGRQVGVPALSGALGAFFGSTTGAMPGPVTGTVPGRPEIGYRANRDEGTIALFSQNEAGEMTAPLRLLRMAPEGALVDEAGAAMGRTLPDGNFELNDAAFVPAAPVAPLPGTDAAPVLPPLPGLAPAPALPPLPGLGIAPPVPALPPLTVPVLPPVDEGMDIAGDPGLVVENRGVPVPHGPEAQAAINEELRRYQEQRDIRDDFGAFAQPTPEQVIGVWQSRPAINRLAESIGERGLDDAVRQLYPDYSPTYTGSGSGTVDKIYVRPTADPLRPDVIVGEAKGNTSRLGTATTMTGESVRQGTERYLQRTIDAMLVSEDPARRAAGQLMKDAYWNGQLRYVGGNTPFTTGADGALQAGATKVQEFPIGKPPF
ncbi:hypothetical protein VQH23_09710 [Pararoseomonas sp. SCSIO 73927]|uniref:hypothetical protein n=1 Tax=Pararoseomonas sp. SCSIO 73927 TaxID=3114537 RepID=UPI0030D52135